MKRRVKGDAELRVLALLGKESRLLRPGYIGSSLWGAGRHRQPQHYARPAGKALRALEGRGFVEWVVRSTEEFGWTITPRGKQFLEVMQEIERAAFFGDSNRKKEFSGILGLVRA